MEWLGRDSGQFPLPTQAGNKPEDVPPTQGQVGLDRNPGPMATGQPTIIGDRLFITPKWPAI